MFGAQLYSYPLTALVGGLLRMPNDGKPISIIDLSNIPSEIVSVAVALISRVVFDYAMWSRGEELSPVLLLCEEAQRYLPSYHIAQQTAAKTILQRIAKEGRKYGVFLGLVTQRPAELDATILSQCSTLFAMRMTNDRDQALLHAAVPDTAADLLSFLPSLGTGEVFAFGEGVALPTRIRLSRLAPHELPKSEAVGGKALDDAQGVAAIVNRWRGGREGDRASEPAPTPGELTLAF